MLAATTSEAQTTRVAPADGYRFHDERSMGPFVIERWVRSSAPDVSPAGMCECLTVVYAGGRRVLTLGALDLASATSISEPSGRDVNGDALPDLVVSAWSGGAHCCYSTSIYTVGVQARPVLALDTGHCGPGELADLDADGRLEFLTCDDGWAYAYCAFALSPFPTVVFAYDDARGEYVADTPRFAVEILKEMPGAIETAKVRLAEPGAEDSGTARCAVLGPVLRLMFAGRLDEGVFLLKALYRRPDQDAFVEETLARVRASRFWVARQGG
jgi:hypothetical protein